MLRFRVHSFHITFNVVRTRSFQFVGLEKLEFETCHERRCGKGDDGQFSNLVTNLFSRMGLNVTRAKESNQKTFDKKEKEQKRFLVIAKFFTSSTNLVVVQYH